MPTNPAAQLERLSRRRASLIASYNFNLEALNSEIRDAVDAGRESGMSMEEIAEALGVSRQRVQQLRGKGR